MGDSLDVEGVVLLEWEQVEVSWQDENCSSHSSLNFEVGNWFLIPLEVHDRVEEEEGGSLVCVASVVEEVVTVVVGGHWACCSSPFLPSYCCSCSVWDRAAEVEFGVGSFPGEFDWAGDAVAGDESSPELRLHSAEVASHAD